MRGGPFRLIDPPWMLPDGRVVAVFYPGIPPGAAIGSPQITVALARIGDRWVVDGTEGYYGG
jgi:hypothetical protein